MPIERHLPENRARYEAQRQQYLACLQAALDHAIAIPRAFIGATPRRADDPADPTMIAAQQLILMLQGELYAHTKRR